MKKSLFCTVGGSYKPVVTAIQLIQPDHTYFICSTKTPSNPSSDSQIIGEGKVIKEEKNEKPTLPNIPTQLNMKEYTYEIIYVYPDDLDYVAKEINKTMKNISKENPESRIFADYTGGTKSMTAGLVLAALENNAELQLVKGMRSDLNQVAEGTEWGLPANVEGIRVRRSLRNQLVSWEQFAYGQAYEGIKKMEKPYSPELQQDIILAMNLSLAFDAWDRFDHKKAYDLLSNCQDTVGKEYSFYFQSLQLLCSDKEATEPAKIYDLWLNAKRRAYQGRYDDAVARVYRIIEWIAQWGLKKRCNVDTFDIPEEFIPKDVKLYKNREGKYQAPLYYAWELLRHRADGPLADFINSQKKGLLTPLDVRNKSILAHGYNPIDEGDWKKVKDWFEDNLLDSFNLEMKNSGLKKTPTQLPQEYIWI